MKAELFLRDNFRFTESEFVEMVAWKVPHPVRGSLHLFKYRFVLVADDVCVLRYDNEAGKGDHRHIGEAEHPYSFVDLDTLISDFLDDVERLAK
jgi:Family of unknown function (DUF6516)